MDLEIEKKRVVVTAEGVDKKVLRRNRKEQVALTVRRFFKNKLAVTGGSIVFIIALIAILAPVIAPHDPFMMNPDESTAPLSRTHILGTDEFGRDTLSRIYYGARISMVVGIISTSIATFFGILIGGVAGFYEGWVDNLLMRLMDSILSFPAVLLAIVLVAILGPSVTNAMVAIGIIYIPISARVVRSAVLATKGNEYVEAARARGKSKFKILFMEILPNCLSPIIVQATVTFADAIIIEAGLSFIGIGAPPPNASWGKMLNQATSYMRTIPHMAIFPGAAISISVLGFNLLGDGLRDVLDPRLRRSAV
jgi:ABC-type dipeptide/oligopeptide/nickel transport system permease subunit